MKYFFIFFSLFSLNSNSGDIANCSLLLVRTDNSINDFFKKIDDILSIELGIGGTVFQKQPNGFWYQEGFEYELKMYGPSANVDLNFNLASDLRLKLGYQYLGKASSSAIATASDANYALCKDDHSLCWPLSHWYGNGKVEQIYLAVDKDLKIMGVKVILEAGITAYRPSWHMNIPDFIWDPKEPPVPLDFSAKYKIKKSATLGLGTHLLDDNTTLMFHVNYTPTNGEEFPAIYKGMSSNITISRKF